MRSIFTGTYFFVQQCNSFFRLLRNVINFSYKLTGFSILIFTLLTWNGCSLSVDIVQRHHMPGLYINIYSDQNYQAERDKNYLESSDTGNVHTLANKETEKKFPQIGTGFSQKNTKPTDKPAEHKDLNTSENISGVHNSSRFDPVKSEIFPVARYYKQNGLITLSKFNVPGTLLKYTGFQNLFNVMQQRSDFAHPGKQRDTRNPSSATQAWMIIGAIALFAGIVIYFGGFGTVWTPWWGLISMGFGVAIILFLLFSDALR